MIKNNQTDDYEKLEIATVCGTEWRSEYPPCWATSGLL